MDDADIILREMADLHKDVDAYKSEWEKRSTTYTTIASKYFARFDAQKTVTLTGTVKELQLGASPALIVLTLKNGEGEADQQWAIETNGLDGVVRERPTTFTPGMPLTLTIHPLRDGTNGGLLLTAVLPDGKEMSGGRDRPVTAQDILDIYADLRLGALGIVKLKRQIIGCSP